MAMLAFVLCVKPFDDGSHKSKHVMTAGDKSQTSALAATIVLSAERMDWVSQPGVREKVEGRVQMTAPSGPQAWSEGLSWKRSSVC